MDSDEFARIVGQIEGTLIQIDHRLTKIEKRVGNNTYTIGIISGTVATVVSLIVGWMLK